MIYLYFFYSKSNKKSMQLRSGKIYSVKDNLKYVVNNNDQKHELFPAPLGADIRFKPFSPNSNVSSL